LRLRSEAAHAAIVHSLVLSIVLAAAPVRYDDHAVVTAWVDDEIELATLRSIAEELWSEHPGPGAIDARIAPGRLVELDAAGIAHVVRIANVQTKIDEEHARLVAAPDPQADAWYDDFRDYDAVMAKLDEIAAAHAGEVELVDVGDSLEGRAIKGLRIGTAAADAPAVLYTGTMHAREWLATMVTMCVVEALVGGDAVAVDLRSRIGILVVPIINPDGYEYSWSTDRYWRKNTRDGYGVDLNRNWDYEWAVVGASDDPYAEDYHGPSAFSEPESSALRDFILAHPEITAHIDFHSFTQLVLRPWGYSYDIPADEATLSMLGDRMSDAIWNATSTDYPSIHASELYPAAGAVDDWGYGTQGIMAFTIELRGDDFVVSPSEIAPACAENVAAALELANWVAGDAPPQGTDDAGADTGGSEGHDPPPTHETTGQAGDDGTGGVLDDAGSEAPSDDDGNGGGSPGDRGNVLPPGYGLGGDATGCACNHTNATPPFALLVAFALRRRRHGT
jgi:zinc carboxypeptidase